MNTYQQLVSNLTAMPGYGWDSVSTDIALKLGSRSSIHRPIPGSLWMNTSIVVHYTKRKTGLVCTAAALVNATTLDDANVPKSFVELAKTVSKFS